MAAWFGESVRERENVYICGSVHGTFIDSIIDSINGFIDINQRKIN